MYVCARTRMPVYLLFNSFRDGIILNHLPWDPKTAVMPLHTDFIKISCMKM